MPDEFVVFANNKNAVYDIRGFSDKATFVFCNHGELFQNMKKGTHPVKWFSRYSPFESGTWNDRINGGHVLPGVSDISLRVCNNYRPFLSEEKRSDLKLLQKSKKEIEDQLKHACQLVDEAELWSLFRNSDIPHDKHLSTGAIAALYIRKNYPTASIKLVGFTKGDQTIENEPHSYIHEKHILISLNCIFT